MEGDRALTKTAELLNETFRSSDVLGRLGGDEFTVFAAVEPDGGVESALDASGNRKFASSTREVMRHTNSQSALDCAIMNPAEAKRSIEDLWPGRQGYVRE